MRRRGREGIRSFGVGLIAAVAMVGGGRTIAACGLDVRGLHGAEEVDLADSASPSPPQPAVDDATTDRGDTDSDAGADAAFDAGYAGRLTAGLVALYEFEEGTGPTVHDSSPAPVDLTIADPAKVIWHPHWLDVGDFTVLRSNGPLSKAVPRCKASNEVTVEAWVRADRASQNDYGRLVTMADNDTTRNFALGSFKDDSLWASLRGGEDLVPADYDVPDALVHVVSTRTNDGTLHLYADGAEIGTRSGTDDFSKWGDYALVVANIATGGRGWRGEIHLVAVYDHALGSDEIRRNFTAGPDPSGP